MLMMLLCSLNEEHAYKDFKQAKVKVPYVGWFGLYLKQKKKKKKVKVPYWVSGLLRSPISRSYRVL